MMSDAYKKVAQYGSFIVELRKQFLENYRKEIGQLMQHAQVLMSILGLIAGFGFTAFQFVKNPLVFFVGEILVITSILYLVFRIKNLIAGQPVATERWINDSLTKVKEIKTALLNHNETIIKKLAEEWESSVNSTSEMPVLMSVKKIGGNLEISFWLGTVGISLIILSFLICG